MLTHLQIRDFAIIESVELELGRGFTALTGETGAGKSILVDALLLAVGGRADSGAVRHGAERAEVSASFDVTRNAGRAGVARRAVDRARRRVHRAPRGRCGRPRPRIPERPDGTAAVAALARRIAGRHPRSARIPVARAVAPTSASCSTAAATSVRSATPCVTRTTPGAPSTPNAPNSSSAARDRDHRLELLRHYVKELDALEPKTGEAAALVEERKRMSGLGRLAEGTAPARSAARRRRWRRDRGAVARAGHRATAHVARRGARRCGAAARRGGDRRTRSAGEPAPPCERARGRSGDGRSGSSRGSRRSSPRRASIASRLPTCRRCGHRSRPNCRRSKTSRSARPNSNADSPRHARPTFAMHGH